MRDEELDRLIDAGLSTYAEPHAGLERRVLATVAANSRTCESRQRLAQWQLWAAGLTAAACLLIALLSGVRVERTHPPAAQQIAHNVAAPRVNLQPVAEPPKAAPVRTASKRSSNRGVEARAHLPKKQIFPTPQPLSPQMQALVRYVASVPKAQQVQLAHAQAQMDAAIVIAPLHIAPLNESTEDEH